MFGRWSCRSFDGSGTCGEYQQRQPEAEVHSAVAVDVVMVKNDPGKRERPLSWINHVNDMQPLLRVGTQLTKLIELDEITRYL